jgi:hypothetical protein
MIGTIAKTYAYAKAPRTTFAALHPKQAVKLGLLKWEIRHAYGARVAAIGVAAVALPLGYLLGRRNGNGADGED